MTTTQLIVAVVVVVVAVAVIGYLIVRQQRSKALREQFGPEYKRAVDEYGSKGRAESVLAGREKRVQKLAIHPLAPEARSRFAARWKSVQARFVDDPAAAISDADALVAQVMSDRGYPMADFDQRAADISVDHPDVVDHYRTAHDIAQLHRQRPVSTEDLRKAFLHYRALFSSLLEVEQTEMIPEKPSTAEREERQTEVRR